MKYLTYKTLVIAGILLLLLSSCGKEEFNKISTDTSIGFIDTILVESAVQIRENNQSTSFNGYYATCSDSSINPGSNQTHILAYGSGLKIEDGEGTFEEPIYILFWTTLSGDFKLGNYLVDGIYVAPDGREEEDLCFNLAITDINEFTISGSFSTGSGSPIERAGTFTTTIHTCAELGIDGADEILITDYTDGRISTWKNGTTTLQMSNAVICPDLFEGQQGMTRMVFGGGKIEIDASGETDFEESPEFLILLADNGAYELNEELKAYYLDDLTLLFSVADPSYEELSSEGSEITVIISSDDNGYFTGVFYGELKDGTVIEGNFRSQISSC